ncbi:hypothetical protein ACIBI9_23020 [Nonomuraea sp. NPDC050451]
MGAEVRVSFVVFDQDAGLFGLVDGRFGSQRDEPYGFMRAHLA